MKNLKRTIIIFILALVALTAQFIFSLYRFSYSIPARFFITGLLYLILPFILFKRGWVNEKKILLYFGIPSLFFLLVAIYASLVRQTIFLIPLGLIGFLSVLFVRFYLYKITVKTLVFYGVFILVSTYIYTIYLLGYSEVIKNNTTIPNDIVFYDENLNRVKLPSNKVLVIDLWSKSCGNCFRKFPEFESLKNDYKNNPNVDFYALCLECKNQKESIKELSSLVKKYTFKKIYCINNDVFEKFDIKGVPVFLITDLNGYIIHKGNLNIKKWAPYYNMHKIINKALDEKK